MLHNRFSFGPDYNGERPIFLTLMAAKSAIVTAFWLLLVLVLTAALLLLLQISATLKHATAKFDLLADSASEQVSRIGDAVAAPCPTYNATHYECGLLAKVGGAVQSYDNLALRLQKPVDGLGTTVQIINRPCPLDASDKLHPCGTLADVYKTLNTARGTMGEVEIAVHHEDKNLAELDTQERELFSQFSNTFNLVDADLTQAHTAIQTADGLLADPSWRQTMGNVQLMTGTGAQMLDTLNQVESKATKSYLHPSANPFVRGWHAFAPFLLPAAEIGGQFVK